MNSGEYISVSKESLEYIFLKEQLILKANEDLTDAIKEVLELLNGDGIPNLEWVKTRLGESICIFK
jgi:hypothetical protein